MQWIVLLVFALANTSYTFASPIDLSITRTEVSVKDVRVLQETGEPLRLHAAQQAFKRGGFQFDDTSFLNFGIGAAPVWLHFNVNNPDSVSLLRRLSIKTSWLDQISVYYLRDDNLVKQYNAGDALPYADRSIKSRYFEFDHLFESGLTTLFIRVQTPDPMSLPIFLYEKEAAYTDSLVESYIYAFIYGVLFALAAYNLILFFTLKSTRYFLYSLYLAMFLLMNMAYSGHGYQWLWSDSPQWQLWSNPILMVIFALTGLLFATSFLNTKNLLVKQHRWVVMGCAITIAVVMISIAVNSPVMALLVAFVIVFVYALTMVSLGALSLYSGNGSAKFFLIASVTHVCTAMITAMTVWGIVPYTAIGFHAVEFGMAIDAILLSLALSDQLRIVNESKLNAERLAMTDHLTGINNRRGFYELVKPLWNTGLRKQRDMSVLILDIDNFKIINDQFGHGQGDKALMILSRVLYDNARSGDIVARWGGEEFIIFLPETNLIEATDIAERFREIIEQTEVSLNEKNIKLTVSIGVSHKVEEKMTIDELISVADTYLYKAKNAGRNIVYAQAELIAAL